MKDTIMNVETERLSLSTRGHTDVIDITALVRQKLQASALKNGVVTLTVLGSTAGLTTIEFEPGLMKDIKELLEKLIPSNKEYHHDATWHDGNGYAHLRSSLIGTSLSLPFVEGEMLLGQWQQIIFLDFDNRPRNRNIILQFMGE